MLRYDDVFGGGVDNPMGASFQRGFELVVHESMNLGLYIALTRGMISAGSVTSRWASSSLNEIRWPTSTSQ